jgi:hypothetical protein
VIHEHRNAALRCHRDGDVERRVFVCPNGGPGPIQDESALRRKLRIGGRDGHALGEARRQNGVRSGHDGSEAGEFNGDGALLVREKLTSGAFRSQCPGRFTHRLRHPEQHRRMNSAEQLRIVIVDERALARAVT